VLDEYVQFVNNENIEEEMQYDIELSDVLFLPDLGGKTPLHYSLDSNNTRVTDRLVRALSLTDFDHHSRFIIKIYPDLIQSVPQTMSVYLDSRLKIPPWIQDYTRGRIDADNECGFVMTADQLWSENLDQSLQRKLYQPHLLEAPLTMKVLDIPHMHKYQNDIADDFFESLAETECIEIFSNISVQALIEIKWPLVKEAIKKYLLLPYVVFLLTFLYYTVGVFEKFHEEPSSEPAGNSTQSLTDQFGANMPDFDQFKDPMFWLANEIIILKVVL